MYSLVALGFVLIYKASGVFNFAQGAMVFFAALTFVSLLKMGLDFWLAFLVTLAAMVALGLLTERIVLRPLVNQPQITLFMATIGLTFVIEGLAQLLGAPRQSGSGIRMSRSRWIGDSAGIRAFPVDLRRPGSLR
jgi:branched-chain amino acid transport system permease protein